MLRQLWQRQPGAPEPLFSEKSLWMLILPLIAEQLLNSLMGMADTMMVSHVGDAAISAASLVDSINNLVLQLFLALAVGGTVICSQYLGGRDEEHANKAARQVMLVTVVISLTLTALCVGLNRPLLKLIFGTVDEEVMENSVIYFRYTALSYPFIALYSTSSAVYRSEGKSRVPMLVSIGANVLNIIGNAIFIFAFHWNIFGAALATLLSRVFSATVMTGILRRPGRKLVVRNYASIRPDLPLILSILTIGIPNGIENGMFQLGKLMIQSSVSTLDTTQLAANAMATTVEYISSMAGMGIGTALMTVVGQCMGAGRKEEARQSIIKTTIYGIGTVIVTSALVFLVIPLITGLTGMGEESADLCIRVTRVICCVKIFTWGQAFVPAYGLRAAGDVKFCMIFSMCDMWLCRVLVSTVLIRFTPLGIWGVWIGMFADWIVRGIGYLIRFHSNRWQNHQVIRQ